MIYDCFTYFGGDHEDALLEMRVHELDSLEVVHVVVESTKTFTGKYKPVTFKTFDPIIHILVTDMPDGSPWDRETHQRNAIMRGLDTAKDDDIIIISDVDEIPRASSIAQYKPEFGSCALVMDQMYYYLNVLASRQSWRIAKILPYSMLKTTTPNEVRLSGNAIGMLDAGFHFSYMGGVDAMMTKLSSFSHQEESERL